MNLFYILNDEQTNSVFTNVLTIFLILLILVIVIHQVSDMAEFIWVTYITPKPFYRHLYFKKHKLTKDQLYILKTEFSFYQSLNPKQKIYFEHRVANFIRQHYFKGRSGVYISNQQKVLIASTAIMLTFGYRNYMIKSLERFIIYPDVFKSKINKAYHKGEFNPAYKAIVFSWKDFLEGL